MEKLSPEQISNNNQNISPTFCVLPWIHLATTTWGELLPCCVGKSLGENLNGTTFSKAWNSSSMGDLRKRMLTGKKSPQCVRCYKEEKVGIASHRMRANAYWKDFYLFNHLLDNTDTSGFFKGQPIYLDLRLGNKCNLECTMCSPQETIRWGALFPKILKNVETIRLKSYFLMRFLFMKIAFSNHWAALLLRIVKSVKTLIAPKRYFTAPSVFIKKPPSKLWYESKEIKQDLSVQMPFLKKITLAGGEPLFIKEHYDFLDQCIERKESHHISLHYHTNGTICGQELFDKWKHFEYVMVFVSLDDIKERNHYIRYPCLWKQIEKNLDRLDKQAPENVHVQILCTMQIKNIFYFEEFLSWFMGQNFKNIHTPSDEVIHTEVVHEPYFLSCQVLPKDVKQIVSQKFENIYKKFPMKTSRWKTIVDFMNAEDKSHLLPVFKDYVQALDKVRGTNFSRTFPELSKLLWKY